VAGGGGTVNDVLALSSSLVAQIVPNATGAWYLPDGHDRLVVAEAFGPAAAALTPRTPPDERLTLAFAPGPDSYPLINYEYAVVSAKQPNPQVASAISNFLLWCIEPQVGSAASLLDPVHFIALPTAIRAQ